MLRKDWKFPYPARSLAAAAATKLAYHDERICWWTDKRAKVMVRNDLRDDLEACLEKLRRHTEQRRDDDGWLQALEANGDQRVELDIEDWLHCFGRHWTIEAWPRLGWP